MLFSGVCCSLFVVVRCLLFVVCSLLFVVGCFVDVVCCLLNVVRCLCVLFVVGGSLLDVCYLLLVGCNVVVCC